MLTALFAGIGLSLSLIVAPGAQNIFLLREGIRHAGDGRRHAIVLALVCLASDVILISAGVAGFGAVVERVPWLFDVARWAGVVFLAGYGLMAAWRVVRPQESSIRVEEDPIAQPEDLDSPSGGGTMTAVRTRAITTVQATTRTRSALLAAVLTCLAITWLNPHTYLDTVLMLGSISTHYGDARALFAVGAVIGSAIWFAFLTLAARYAARWLRSPRSWRVLDGVIAVVMLALASALAAA
nr:LysE/ArgO family amino acid transporter [Microbacterium indicum]